MAPDLFPFIGIGLVLNMIKYLQSVPRIIQIKDFNFIRTLDEKKGISLLSPGDFLSFVIQGKDKGSGSAAFHQFDSKVQHLYSLLITCHVQCQQLIICRAVSNNS